MQMYSTRKGTAMLEQQTDRRASFIYYYFSSKVAVSSYRGKTVYRNIPSGNALILCITFTFSTSVAAEPTQNKQRQIRFPVLQIPVTT